MIVYTSLALYWITRFKNHIYSRKTYSLGAWCRNFLSCCNAVPAIILTRNTFTKINKWYFAAAFLSKEEKEVKPSILDINIRTIGTRRRNIFNMMPGKYPWTKDLTDLLKHFHQRSIRNIIKGRKKSKTWAKISTK